MYYANQKLEAILSYLTSSSESERNAAYKEMKSFSGRPRAVRKTAKTAIGELLLEVGIPDHLLGYEYIVKAVELALENKALLNQVVFQLYPSVAAKCDTTAARVERAIRHAIEVAWINGDPEILTGYFGNTVSPRKGNPTNAQFIARMVNIIKGQMVS